MHSTFCCAMLALPVIGWNAVSSFTTINCLQSFDNKSKITDVITGVKIVQPYLTPVITSARDDRIKDCLRSGNCKN